MLSKSFKAGKCKTSLKLAVARIKLLKNKREVQVKQMRRDLAQLLETGQDQTARIRVEHVIREEKTMSAYDLIELYCELIVARLAIIESQKICPIDLKEAISSVIFASPRCADIPELLDVRKHFAAKYGKEFATSALELRPDCGVNRLIVEKLSAKAPDIETKTKVLTAIAQEHSIKWDPKAFEEQVQKPSEDLLNGPNSFTNKMPVESSTVQFSPSPAEKHKSVTKPTEKNLDRSSFGSNSFSPPVESASQPGPRAAASTYDGGESGHSYFREEVASSNRQKWAMEFKDATSAAQAAAESAERASMAARAAAELASRGHNPEYSYGSHEPSIYGSKHEAGNLMRSKLQGDSLARDSINRDHGIDKATYATKQRMQSGLEAERVQDHVARYSKSIYEDSETAQNQYSRVVSSSSVHSSSEKDATEANWQRKKIVKDNSSDEENDERNPIRPLSSHPSNRSHDGFVPVSNVQKSDSFTSESFFKADPVNEDLSERTDLADAGRGGIGRISSKSLSSHSSVSSINHETIWDSPMHRNYVVNQHSPFGAGEGIDQGGHRHGFSDDAPVVFDQSDPEDDDHPEIDKFIEKEDLVLTSKHPEANFLVSSSNVDYSAPDQQNGRFTVKDGSSSSRHSVSRLQVSEFSGIARGDNPLSQSDAVAYDVSDGASSDGEDQMIESTDRGDTVLSSLHNKKNVDTYEHPQSLSRSSLQDMEAMDKLDQFSSSFTDADAECHSTYAGGRELDFGRLTGGLRNKGHLRPPYVKNPVVNEALQSETSTDDSSKKLMAFPKDRTARSVDVRKNVNNWKPHFKTDEDSRSRSQNSSDPDNFDDPGQHPSPGRRGYCSVAPPLSTSKLDANLTIDNEQKVSSTFIKPESNEISQEKPHGRSVRRTSKESSRTSAASYIDEDTEKQCLSPAGRDTSSILSRQKPEDTKIAVPNTTRISGHADNYGKKSSVRSSKGSTSTATSFFDEENDEDVVFQPRDTGGNLGTRSGMRLSQRTRGSRVDQHNLKTADLESKSVESTSFMSETSLKSSTTGVKPEKDRTSKFFPPKLSIEEHSPHLSEKTEVLVQKDDLSGHSVAETPFKPSVSSVKPSVSSVKPEKNKTSKFLPPNFSTEQHPEMHSEAEILTQKDDPERSQRGSSHNNPSVSVSLQTGVPASNETVKPSTSRENSFKGSHVHPKLPDYETLADYFKSLRSNRR